MTKDQFREMVEGIVERKLVELLGDPDDGLPDSEIRARPTPAPEATGGTGRAWRIV